MIRILIFSLVFLFNCKQKKVQVEEVGVGTADNEIVFFNIGDRDRAEIADMLLQIEKCNPSIIAVDALFINNGEPFKDSALKHAFNTIKNDILAYRFDPTGNLLKPVEWLSDKATGEGFINVERRNGLSNHFIPLKEVNGVMYESFALKIIKFWKPSFKLSISPNKSIEILFKRTQEDFHYFEKPNLEESQVREHLSQKVVIVGYLGPSSEDKHFTPLRSKLKIQSGEPDTYGVVIQANAIRTLLEYYNEE